MAEISKQVGNRVKWARFVVASYRSHGAEVEGTLSGIYATGQVGATMAALAARLTAVTDTMYEAELALSVELSDDAPARTQRDEAAEALRQALFQARALVDGAFGEEAVVTYGLLETPPRQPDDLVAYARNAANLLRVTPRSAADAFGNSIDTVPMADALDGVTAGLRAALEVVDAETREAHIARAARDEAVEVWTRVYRGTAGTLSSLYLLAGRDDLAERVRPTVRRSSGIVEPPVDVDGGESTEVEPEVIEEPVV